MTHKLASFKYLPLLVFQLVLMVLYFVFTRYGGHEAKSINVASEVHVMIYIGFGFLMTFLKKYCYSALGYNWLLGAVSLQWALLCQSFYHMKGGYIYITEHSIVEADILTATVLITFGAILGVSSGLQLLVIAIIEIPIAAFNLWLVADYFKAADVGGSIAIHAFGAYFGLGVSWALNINKVTPKLPENFQHLNIPSYVSDVTAMIGSIFLWIYWPWFNAALSQSDAETNRIYVNTSLALASAAVTAFVISTSVSHGKLDMVHIQNSTLAGGVAVGSVSNMHINPGGAIAIGIVAGVLSVLGYKYLTPNVEKLGFGDTCGVNNLHGMPGILSGILTVAFAAVASGSIYGEELPNIFSSMQVDGTGRTAKDQALYQLYALLATLVVSLVGGVVTGFIARIPLLEPVKHDKKYDDEPNWELP